MLDENCAASSNRMHIKRTGFDTEVLCVNVQTLISVYICKLILARVFSLHYHPFVCCSTTATWLHALCDMLNPIGGWALGGSPHFYTPRPCPRGGGAGQVVRSLCPVTEVLCVWPRRSRILRLAVSRASPSLAIWGSFSRFRCLSLAWLARSAIQHAHHGRSVSSVGLPWQSRTTCFVVALVGGARGELPHGAPGCLELGPSRR